MEETRAAYSCLLRIFFSIGGRRKFFLSYRNFFFDYYFLSIDSTKIHRGGSATPATSKMDFSVTNVQLLIVVSKSLLHVVCVLDRPQLYIGLSKRSRVYLSHWCLCALATLFQRPLNASLLLDRPILHQNRGTR